MNAYPSIERSQFISCTRAISPLTDPQDDVDHTPGDHLPQSFLRYMAMNYKYIPYCMIENVRDRDFHQTKSPPTSFVAAFGGGPD